MECAVHAVTVVPGPKPKPDAAKASRTSLQEPADRPGLGPSANAGIAEAPERPPPQRRNR